MNPPDSVHRHRVGITRRELIQVGYSGLLGIGLPSLLAARAVAEGVPARAKSVLLIFLTGRRATSTPST